MLLANRERLFRLPESHNVIEGFILGRDFDQHNGALAPLFRGIYPDTGALLVEHAIILIVIKIAIALQQPEAFGIVITETVYPHIMRIDQRSP